MMQPPKKCHKHRHIQQGYIQAAQYASTNVRGVGDICLMCSHRDGILNEATTCTMCSSRLGHEKPHQTCSSERETSVLPHFLMFTLGYVLVMLSSLSVSRSPGRSLHYPDDPFE